MPDTPLDPNDDQMLQAALGGLSTHEALLKASREDAEKTEERAAAIAKNRERALKLLEAIEQSQKKTSDRR